MIINLIRKELLLSYDNDQLPSRGSANISVSVSTEPDDSYADYYTEVHCSYLTQHTVEEVILEKEDDFFIIPGIAFAVSGNIALSVNLVKDSTVIVTNEVSLFIKNAPHGGVVLPATKDWHTFVQDYVDGLYISNYKPLYDSLVEEAQRQQQTASDMQQTAIEQQENVDDAISIMGEYEIVNENPTQIHYKKGNGQWGDTVNLGDNLASKSQVYSGHDTYAGNSYSGLSSDSGIEIASIKGNYKQETTNGYQLFDASKLATKTIGGATVTNNGDGSFTISGNGNLTEAFGVSYFYTHEETIKLLKAGTIQLGGDVPSTLPRLSIYIVTSSGNKNNMSNNKIGGGKSTSILQETLNDANAKLVLTFYGSANSKIQSGTIKPMLYQLGTGEWEPFTGGQPSPNPSYQQDPKFFEMSEFVSHSNNLFDQSKLPTKSQGGATVTNNEDGSFTITGNGNLTEHFNHVTSFTHEETLKLIRAGKLTLVQNGNTYPRAVVNLRSADGTKNYFSLNETATYVNVTEEMINDGGCRLAIYISGINGMEIKAGTIKPMLYQDGNGVWEKFNLDTTPTSLTLRALPNGVCDIWEDGVITRRVGKITFDGSEDEVWSSQDGRFYISIPGKKYGIDQPLYNLICNKLRTEPWNILIANMRNMTIKEHGGQTNERVYIRNDSCSTIEELKTWLQSNPVTVWYELATPTTESLEIPTLPSYNSYTNIFHDSELVATEIKWNINNWFLKITDGNGNLYNGPMTPKDNLLINSDFRSGVINQKGETSYGYVDKALLTIDGWISYGVNVGLDADSIRIINRQTSDRTLRQYVDGEGGTYTVYVNVKSITGNVYVNFNQDISKNKKLVQGENVFQITLSSSETLSSFTFLLESSADIYIYQIKLEKGSYFTGMPEWNETVELLKCQKYQYILKSYKIQGSGTEGNQFVETIVFPTKMYKAPSGTLDITQQTGVSDVKVNWTSKNVAQIYYKLTASIYMININKAVFDAYIY